MVGENSFMMMLTMMLMMLKMSFVTHAPSIKMGVGVKSFLYFRRDINGHKVISRYIRKF